METSLVFQNGVQNGIEEFCRVKKQEDDVYLHFLLHLCHLFQSRI